MFGHLDSARLYVLQLGVRLYLRSICLIIVCVCVVRPSPGAIFFTGPVGLDYSISCKAILHPCVEASRWL